METRPQDEAAWEEIQLLADAMIAANTAAEPLPVETVDEILGVCHAG